MKIILRVLSFGRPLGWIIPKYLILVVLTAIFSVINFTVIIPLLQVLFGTVDVSVVNRPEFSFSISYFKEVFYYQLTSLIDSQGGAVALYFICGIVVSSVFLASVSRYFSQLVISAFQIRLIKNLRNKLFQNVVKIDYPYFASHKKGDTTSRIMGDISEIEKSLGDTLRALIREPILIAGYFIALFSISAELTLYTLLLLPLSGTVISVITKKLKRSALKSQETAGEMHHVVDETLTGIRLVKVFDAVNYVSNRFKEKVDQHSMLNFKIANRTNLASPTSEFLGAIILTVILLIGGNHVLEENATVNAAQFIGFLLIFAQVLNPIKAIAAAFGSLQRGVSASERVFDLMEKRSDTTVAEKIKLASFTDSIEFENVSFAYDQEHILNSISFCVRKGESVALVGPSGGGKTTVIDLLLGLYQPSIGKITIDKNPLNAIDVSSFRKMVGVVPQETILFHDSIKNNIAFGSPDVSMEQIEWAAGIANASEFISHQKDGYETVIGDRGNKLSGGQQQRICIARAVLNNPPILIFDEATSSLDAHSEEAVQQAIKNLMKDRTVVLIAHRLSTVIHADKILVINEGKIVEEGSHGQLVNQNGLYQKLSEMQSF